MASGLAACGGGGGGSSTPPGGGTPTAVPTKPGGGVTPTPVGMTPTPAGQTPTPVPTPTPTGKAYSLPAPVSTALSVFSAGSNPAGLVVKVNGTQVGVTPPTPGFLQIPAANVPYGLKSYNIEIDPAAPSTSAPYVVTVAQYGNATRTVFYNGVLDDQGTVSNINTLSVARRNAESRTSNAYAAAVSRPAARTLAGPLTVSGMQHGRVNFRARPASLKNRPLFSSKRIAITYDASKFDASRTFASVESSHGAAKAVTLSQGSGRVSRVITLAPGQTVASAMGGFRHERGVLSVDRVRMRYPLAYSGTFLPNDPMFAATTPAQWYLYQIDSEDAWGYGPGTAPIAVIDTGYDASQTELASQVKYSEAVINGDVYAFAGAANDTDGHGTFLSGVLGAMTDNNAGFAGASYNAPLLEFKIAADAPAASVSADTADEAQAIYDAVGNGAKVILIAFGGDASAGPDPNELTAVQYALSHGVAVVAGSGDDAATSTVLDFPAGYSGVISVGASQYNDTASPPTESVAAYSNAGPGLGLVAPGGQGTPGDTDLYHWIENVYATKPYAGNPTCATVSPSSSCAILYTGTSPAAALVAGTVSMMFTQNPNLSPQTVANILYNTTVNINDPNQGHGRLNAYQAVTMAAGGLPPTPGPSATPNPSPPPAFQPPSGASLVAFAYSSNGDIPVPYLPTFLNQTYTAGVPLSPTGTFRMADILPNTQLNNGNYRIGVWLDLNGDGKISAGDYFGSAACNSITKPCNPTITMTLVTSATEI